MPKNSPFCSRQRMQFPSNCTVKRGTASSQVPTASARNKRATAEKPLYFFCSKSEMAKLPLAREIKLHKVPSPFGCKSWYKHSMGNAIRLLLALGTMLSPSVPAGRGWVSKAVISSLPQPCSTHSSSHPALSAPCSPLSASLSHPSLQTHRDTRTFSPSHPALQLTQHRHFGHGTLSLPELLPGPCFSLNFPSRNSTEPSLKLSSNSQCRHTYLEKRFSWVNIGRCSKTSSCYKEHKH